MCVSRQLSVLTDAAANVFVRLSRVGVGAAVMVMLVVVAVVIVFDVSGGGVFCWC